MVKIIAPQNGFFHSYRWHYKNISQVGGLVHLYGWHCEKNKNYNVIHTSIFSQIFTISFVEVEFFTKSFVRMGKPMYKVANKKYILHDKMFSRYIRKFEGRDKVSQKCKKCLYHFLCQNNSLIPLQEYYVFINVWTITIFH